MTLLPALATDLVPELLAVVERLDELLARETKRLGTPAPSLDDGLTVEKSRLVVRYDTLLIALSRMPAETVKASAGADRLASAMNRLRRRALDNASAIERHLTATRHVIDIVTRAARDQTRATFSYGTERLGYGARGGHQAAVAVNRIS